MKRLLILFLLIQLTNTIHAQNPAGTIITNQIQAPSLQIDDEEIPTRRVTIYLPPGYEQSDDRFPVIYYLHGFSGSDSLQIAVDRFDLLLDKAIETGKINPVIVVLPDHNTEYRGSFYTNSTLTGNWADFTAKDVVEHVDRNFRTIPDRSSRGITGHSMGGHGAIKLGMLFPDVFASVYALSPAVLGLVKELGADGEAYQRAQLINTKKELVSGFDEILANIVVALGRAFSPNPDNPPFYMDLPFTYQEDSLIVNYEVLELWNANIPLEMVNDYIHNLKKLTALKLDWGRNDELLNIPITSRMFSIKLENMGIKHYAEEYIGTHGNMLWTDDGRALNVMLPFFNTNLTFD